MSTIAPSTGDPTPVSVPRGRRTRPTRRVLALAALGVAAVTLAACGSSSSASTTSTTKAKAAVGRRGFGAGGPRPGTSGTIAAITGTSLEVQNPTSGQTTVTYTSATTFDQTVSAAASGVTVGSCISAFGKPTSTSSTGKSAFGGPVTATTVTISQPVSGSCTTGFGGGGFGGGGAGRPGGFTGGTGAGGRAPGGGAGRFRGGAGGQFGAASGQVTAVSGSTATVNEVNPSTKATSSVVITLTASTTYTERTSATAADLAVGQCATAIGTADSTGAVTARSISLSQPVSGSCTTGFGGFGRFGGGGAPGQGGSTGA